MVEGLRGLGKSAVKLRAALTGTPQDDPALHSLLDQLAALKGTHPDTAAESLNAIAQITESMEESEVFMIPVSPTSSKMDHSSRQIGCFDLYKPACLPAELR